MGAKKNCGGRLAGKLARNWVEMKKRGLIFSGILDFWSY
jgi:hypothetical protein